MNQKIDYRDKYLKYKKKYFNLKDQIAGRNLNQVFNWTTKPLIDYDSEVKYAWKQDCNKHHLSFKVSNDDELVFLWCDEKEEQGTSDYASKGKPAEKYIEALMYLIRKIGTPEFVFKGGSGQKYGVSSKVTGLDVKNNVENSSGFKLEWEIEGLPIKPDRPENLKPKPFNKDKDLKTGLGFQIKEGCMEKKIVDLVKFKENFDSFNTGFINLFEKALPASKKFIELACKPPCKTGYPNKNAPKEELLKRTKEFVKKFEDLWNFCHEFSNKIRESKDCNYSNMI